MPMILLSGAAQVDQVFVNLALVIAGLAGLIAAVGHARVSLRTTAILFFLAGAGAQLLIAARLHQLAQARLTHPLLGAHSWREQMLTGGPAAGPGIAVPSGLAVWLC